MTKGAVFTTALFLCAIAGDTLRGFDGVSDLACTEAQAQTARKNVLDLKR